MSFSEGQSRAFVDCWFTLAALDSDPDQQKHVRNVIRKAGGRIFDAGRLNLVTNTSGTYAVCPFGFPPQARKEAMRHADFKKGDLSKQPPVTHHKAIWARCSSSFSTLPLLVLFLVAAREGMCSNMRDLQ